MRVFHAQLLCISALLSPPKSLAHVPPGIRLIQGDISFAILITARCGWKQNISANEQLRDETLAEARSSPPVSVDKTACCVFKKRVPPFCLVCRNTPQQKHNFSQSLLGFRLPQRGQGAAPVHSRSSCLSWAEESRCGFVQRWLDLC